MLTIVGTPISSVPVTGEADITSPARMALLIGVVLVGCDRPSPSRPPVDVTASDTVTEPIAHAELNVRPQELAVLSADTSFGKIDRPVIDGEHVWVVDFAGDPALHVIDLVDGKRLLSTGGRGEGPGEFISIGDLSARGNTPGVWAFDGNTNRMTALQIKNNIPSVAATISLPVSPRVRRTVQRGSGFVAWTSDSVAQITVLDSAGNVIRRVGGMLLGADSITARRRITLSTSNTICSHPDGNRIAVGYLAAGRVAIFDLKTDSSWNAAVPYPTNGIFVKNDRGELVGHRSTLYYVSCAATRDAIYMLFSGRQMPIPPPEGWRDGPEASTFVHVFDWNGLPLAYLELDQAVTSIAVSTNGRTLIGVDRPGGRIFRSALPKW